MKSIFMLFIFGIISFFDTKYMMKEKFLRKPTSECVEYIKSFKLKLSDNDPFQSIPGLGGLVYNLPTQEVVLIPTDFEAKYSGFIFSNKKAFQETLVSGFFPVAENELTSWEVEKFNLEKLPTGIEVFRTFLKNNLKVERVNISTISDLELLYDKVVKFIKDKSNPQIIKERVVLAFGILIIDLMVTNGGGEWKLIKKYEVYNSYDYPVVQIGEETKDIINELYIVLSDSPSNFDFFRKSLEIDLLLGIE